MGAGRDGMQQVELVEHEIAASSVDGLSVLGADDAPAPGRFAAVGSRLAHRARRHRRPLAALAVVVVLALVGVRVGQWRQERVYLEGLVGVPGVLAPVDAEPTELWRAMTGLVSDDAWQVVGDALIGAGDGAEGTQVVSLDVRTGEARWTTSLRGTTEPVFPPTCVPVEGPPPVLVCATGTLWGVDGPTPRTVAVLDRATGEVLVERDVAEQVTIAALDGGVVVAELSVDGHLHVALRDPVTWAETWGYDTDVEVPVAAGADDSESVEVPSYQDPQLVVADDGTVGAMAMAGTGTAGAVLSPDGRVLRDLSLHPAWPTVIGGRLFLQSWAAAGTDGAGILTLTDLSTGRETDVVDSGGGVDVAGDGSLGSVRITSDAWGTGESENGVEFLGITAGARWTLPVTAITSPWDALVVREQVVLSVDSGPEGKAGGGELVAFDGQSGRERWRVPAVLPSSGSMVSTTLMTDGLAVLTVEFQKSDAHVGRVLTAFDVGDGHRQWSVPLPDGVSSLRVIGDSLFGFTGAGEIVAVG